MITARCTCGTTIQLDERHVETLDDSEVQAARGCHVCHRYAVATLPVGGLRWDITIGEDE